MREIISLNVAEARVKGLDPNTLAPRPAKGTSPWVNKETSEIVFVIGAGPPTEEFRAAHMRLDEWETLNGKPHPEAARALQVARYPVKKARISFRGCRPKSFIEHEKGRLPPARVLAVRARVRSGRNKNEEKNRREISDAAAEFRESSEEAEPPDNAATNQEIAAGRVLDTPFTIDEDTRKQICELSGDDHSEIGEAARDLAITSRDAPLSDLFDNKPQLAAPVNEAAIEAAEDEYRGALSELTSPERVVETLRRLKFGDAEHVATLVGIIRDIGALDKDRIAAMGELRTIIRETAIALGVSVGEVKRALATGDWNPLAERTLAEKVAAGDMEAIKTAIFSGKVSSLKIPEKNPAVAVVSINGTNIELSQAQREKLARLDELLVLPEERRRVTHTEITSISADTPTDLTETDTGVDMGTNMGTDMGTSAGTDTGADMGIETETGEETERSEKREDS